MALPINDAGQVALYVRSLDDDTVRALPGTTGGNLLFWARDSRGIAFFANGQLKRTDRDGAPVQTVGDAAGAQGGTWAPDVTIVIGSNAGPLRRLPANGGELVEITKVDQLKESSHHHPMMLPDGGRFLYFTASVQPGGSVVIGSLDDDSKTPVFPSDSNAEYLDGHLLFVRGGALLAQPFDAATQRILVNVMTNAPTAPDAITIVTNWTSLLRR